MILLSSLLISNESVAQQIQWVRPIGSFALRLFVNGLASSPDGVYALAGPHVRKYSVSGELIWQRQVVVPGGFQDIAADETGAYVAGYNTVARLAPNGTLLWLRTFAPPLRNIYQFSSVTVRNSAVYAAGYFYTAWPDRRLGLVKLDRDGNDVWAAPIEADVPDDTFVADEGLSLAADDQAVYLTGLVGADVRRFKTQDGSELPRLGDGPPPGLENLGVTVSDSGIYVLVPAGGPSADPAGSTVRKYARDGRLLWQKQLALPGDVTLRPAHYYKLAGDGDGIFVAGYAVGSLRAGGIVVLRLGADGHEVWSFTSDLSGVPVGLTLQAGAVYTAFLGPEPTYPLVKLSQDLPPQVQTLRADDGATTRQLVAVLGHDSGSGRVSVLVKDAATGALVRRIAFDRSG